MRTEITGDQMAAGLAIEFRSAQHPRTGLQMEQSVSEFRISKRAEIAQLLTIARQTDALRHAAGIIAR